MDMGSARVGKTVILEAKTGQLIVRGRPCATGTVTVLWLDDDGRPMKAFYSDYETHRNDGEEIREALFPNLPAGKYRVSERGPARCCHRITVFPAHVSEIELT